MSKQYQKVMSAAVLTVGLMVAGSVRAGSLDPTNAPGPTMHTLEEIYQKVANLAPQDLQTLSDTTAVVNAGYYEATTLTGVDTDLAAGNIKNDVAIFGVTGTMYNAAVPKTGQTTLYVISDDGDLERGVTWPSPRFTVQTETNCVVDNLTGLMWTRNANLPAGLRTWTSAISYCTNMNAGAGTYGYTDWRLPNVKELQSLIDYGRYNPALPSGHPFTGVQSDGYWSSSTYVGLTGYAWYVNLGYGGVSFGSLTHAYYVWPVRGGQ